LRPPLPRHVVGNVEDANIGRPKLEPFEGSHLEVAASEAEPPSRGTRRGHRHHIAGGAPALLENHKHLGADGAGGPNNNQSLHQPLTARI
jgi:hypothetical protein